MGDRPYLELELDEHTADAGVITRIEAFYDSYRNTIRYAKGRSEERKAKGERRHCLDATGKDVHEKGRVMAFSYMHDAAFALAAIFRSRGFDAVVLPRTSPESLALGKRYSSGKECVPYQTTLGDKLLFLTSDEKRYQVLPDEIRTYPKGKGPRPEDVVFYAPYAQGPCRFGQYNEGYKRVYEDLGIDTHILASGAHNNYADVFRSNWDGLKFVVLACDAVVATDVFHKAKRVLRPVAKDPARVTALYNRAIAELVEIVEPAEETWSALRGKQRGLEVLLDRVGAEFGEVELDPAKVADVANVSIFGEIYVRCEQFINEFIMDRLEEYGIRSFLAPMNEWIQYVNYEFLWDLKTEEKMRFGAATVNPFKMTGKLLHRRKQIGPSFRRRHVPRRLERFSRAFRGLSGWQDDPFTEDTIAAGTNKIPFNLKGELVLSWGVAREAQHNPDMHGLVNIGPFGCMPSKLVSVLLHDKEITKPVFDGNYDGSVANSRTLKIETFASQVKAYARSVRESGRGHEHAPPKFKLKLGDSRAVEV